MLAPLPAMPDVNDERYCRVCQKSLPLSQFPSGQRRYVLSSTHVKWIFVYIKCLQLQIFLWLSRYICKKDLWTRIGQKSRQTRHSNVFKKTIDALWTSCWKIAKHFNVTLTLTSHDLKTILHKIQDSSEVAIDQIALVPTDPSQAFDRQNYTAILKCSKQKLLSDIRTLSQKHSFSSFRNVCHVRLPHTGKYIV